MPLSFCSTGDEEHLTTQVCIVLIFGIPASGKTYIARELVVKEMQLFGETCCVVHICMDDFYPKDTRDEATFVYGVGLLIVKGNVFVTFKCIVLLFPPKLQHISTCCTVICTDHFVV